MRALRLEPRSSGSTANMPPTEPLLHTKFTVGPGRPLEILEMEYTVDSAPGLGLLARCLVLDPSQTSLVKCIPGIPPNPAGAPQPQSCSPTISQAEEKLQLATAVQTLPQASDFPGEEMRLGKTRGLPKTMRFGAHRSMEPMSLTPVMVWGNKRMLQP